MHQRAAARIAPQTAACDRCGVIPDALHLKDFRKHRPACLYLVCYAAMHLCMAVDGECWEKHLLLSLLCPAALCKPSQSSLVPLRCILEKNSVGLSERFGLTIGSMGCCGPETEAGAEFSSKSAPGKVSSALCCQGAQNRIMRTKSSSCASTVQVVQDPHFI